MTKVDQKCPPRVAFSPQGGTLMPRGGGVLWYFHTYMGSGHFLGVQNFEFQYFGGFSEKAIIVGYEGFEDIFAVNLKLDYI